MPRFSANLSMMFTERPFAARFVAAKAAGFEAVEFLFPYAFDAHDVAALLRDNGLDLSVFNLPCGNWDKGERGLAALKGRDAEFLESVAVGERYAQAFGAKRVHVMAGIADGTEAEACFITNVRRAADRLAALDCTVMIEPISAQAMQGYFLNRTDQALALLDKIDHENVALQWDAFHHTLTHGLAIDAVGDVIAKLAHVQVAGVPERHEPWGFAALFEALDAAGYGGWIGCEYRPKGRTEDGLDWREETTNA